MIERFDRQLTLPGFPADAQLRLRNATALVAGVGGVGGAAATYLAAAGVGRLVLLHPGPLELPDLNRQTLMRPEWLGRSRADCAADTLAAHYPDVEVVALAERVDESSTGRWLQETTIALDCRHNFPERFLLNELCVRTGVPCVFAAMNAGEGHVTVVRPGRTACLRCLFVEGDPAWEPLGFAVLGAVAGTVGTLAALEAVKVLTGWGLPLHGRLLVMDLSDATFRSYWTKRDPACPVCSDRQRPRDQILVAQPLTYNTTLQRMQRS